MLGITNSLLEKANPKALKITLTENSPPKVSIIPFRKNKVAVISVVSENSQTIKEISGLDGFSGAWVVTEALPVKYEISWNKKEKTPGACLLTLFKQRKDIDYNTFIDRWHNSHTPLSLKIHPLWHYNRNVLDGKLTENSEGWDGIVEEHCKTASELLNPLKFFGGPLKMLPNMLKVYTDTKSFLDYKTIETYLVSEYIFV
jgi:hypothetical protein